MSRRTVVLIVFAVWLALFASGILGYMLTEPSGDGFHRGLNRAGTFLGFEIAAALAAIGSWIAMRRLRDSDRSILIAGYAPPILSGLLWGVLVIFVVVAIISAQFSG